MSWQKYDQARAKTHPHDKTMLGLVGTHMTIAPKLHEAAAARGITRENADASLMRLHNARKIILHQHTSPMDPDRPRMIQAEGKAYVGAHLRGNS